MPGGRAFCPPTRRKARKRYSIAIVHQTVGDLTRAFPEGRVATDHGALLRNCGGFIDVRAPVEFGKGAVPGACNLPILNDDERAAVGTRYRQGGQQAAVALGEELVSGAVRAERIEAWAGFARDHPECTLYCARGGLRSRIAQAWLAEAGIAVPRVEGGFKSLRQFCLRTIDDAAASLRFIVVGGRTGSGKTAVLARAAASIDLERLANHRGSAFGERDSPQPPPIGFENALAVELLRLSANGESTPVAVEDESRQIGRLAVPVALYEAMQAAPIVVIEADLDIRVHNILTEYVLEAPNPHQHLPASFARIRKRLGGARHREIGALLTAALAHDDPDMHRAWIRRLLTDYYDPMYDYQIAAKQDRIVHRGNLDSVAAYLGRCEGPVDGE